MDSNIRWRTCPKCESTQVIVSNMSLVALGDSALMPVDTWEVHFQCKDCGHTWKEQQRVPDTTGEY